MTFLSYAYRFVSNFLFMALVYFSLNYVDKYQQRAIIAMMVLGYVVMRTVSALRSFYFFQRIERLEIETKRLATALGIADAARKQVGEVSMLRRHAEVKSYIDLFFQLLIVVLCLGKIVTS